MEGKEKVKEQRGRKGKCERERERRGKLTHSRLKAQWAAVTTTLGAMRVPPQK